jgi:hypothetical protein
MRRSLFRRSKKGTIAVTLSEDEAALLRSLPAELAPVIGGSPDTDIDVVARLFPSAYSDPTEAEAEGEWQRLMHDELVREKLAALEIFTVTLAAADRKRGKVELELRDDDVAAWLGALNDARLALGTRLDVTEELDHDIARLDSDDPYTQALAVYLWLGWAQELLLEALAS